MLHVFGVYWEKQKIQEKCDNLAVVQFLTSGKTRDPFLGACAQNISMVTA